ncbi:MAG: hypothetical protein J6S68_07660, partial [Acinetobacter sp.]|nr:hypothetical protein [Acinetobacter sp.]
MTLPSNASKDIYPNNKISQYTTKFAKPIDLKGNWEVSLSEVQYVHSWNTLSEEDSECSVCWREDKGVSRVSFKINHGYYKSIEDLVKEINEVMQISKLSITIVYNPVKNKIHG